MGLVFLIFNFFIIKKIIRQINWVRKKNTFLSESGFSSWDKKMFTSVCTRLYVVSSWAILCSQQWDFGQKVWFSCSTLMQKTRQTESRSYILWFDEKKYCAPHSCDFCRTMAFSNWPPTNFHEFFVWRPTDQTKCT